ncbi:MAG: class II aldolase/adducin family protein [Myxococcota bacterium]|nr:class II aldolase/adducin family protein [Myxococcota bacterium]
MAAAGLSVGTSGNVSLRTEEGLLITPTGLPYESLRPSDLVEVDWDGRPHGHRAPSSEWRMHLDLFAAREDARVIVHCHPPHGTTLASLRREIPAFHYMVAVAGGSSIRCAPYATFGTPELAATAVEALRDRRACLLANHGMLALGASLEAALKLSIEVENLAGQYWRALCVGEPAILDEAEMQRVLEKFRTYGQQQPARVRRAP